MIVRFKDQGSYQLGEHDEIQVSAWVIPSDPECVSGNERIMDDRNDERLGL